ncbi:MAG: bifunctional riboflavin kinase/FAD synthetase [Geminicoccaceae bacterium]|nr:bifunctional riboflavin kinase/FAD synthetase [Geminicoccaceae bacterium]MDW8124352.1 bifunctional riboflavin kinase/FAD synthetase [Geminicoccaceae bacterium]
MRVVRRFAVLPAAARGAAVAIGNFDGVHLGHRAVLGAAQRLARERACRFGVVTFEPHPREVLDPAGAPARLTPFRRKAELLRALGVELLVALPFDRALARLEPETFVRELLVERIGAAAIATGVDFRFGRERRGDVALLAELARRSGFALEAVAPVDVDGERCSSSAIRAHLAAGRVERAARLLGRPYDVEGRVRPGDRRGRELGFPTANIDPPPGQQLPADGVYAVEARLEGESAQASHPAVANLGWRPTFAGRRRLLEVHLLDGCYDLYGRRLRVAFLARLREERRFADRAELVAQIARDCEAARRILNASSLAVRGPSR